MRRIVVLGTSGSGKTTLAGALARRLGLSHIELDALHWNPNWVSTPADELRTRISRAIDASPQGWTVCGNYRVANERIWREADTIIWLDYPMTIVMYRVTLRTLRRAICRTELWNGNRERVLVQLFTRDSLFLWVINTWRKRRRDYPKELAQLRRRGVRVFRFRDPRQTEAWLNTTVPSVADRL